MSEPAGLSAILAHRSRDPFGALGPHDGKIFVYLPGATGVEIVGSLDDGSAVIMDQIDPAGLFSGDMTEHENYKLRIDWGGILQETEDPYAFPPLLGDVDLHLLAEGRHRHLATCLGAQVIRVNGVDGVRFAVWAPNASRVSVVGDFNTWNPGRHSMRFRHDAGVWELFIPRLGPGEPYKFAMLGPDGVALPYKADPVASQAEAAPATASVVANPAPLYWTDAAWMRDRPRIDTRHRPISIYEVHAASWMHADGRPLQWDELAEKLIAYATDMGFTHLEFLPIMVHPFGGSWGYQPLGQFAPTAELGTPEAFARLVDLCHAAGLGVILDWVPAHFPDDAHGLAQFDGTCLYEHADPREGLHRDWNTLIYNLGRNEVRGFLIASALHWLNHFHVDALRVDAVASMLYRDYSREPGDWVPNIYGGRENLESISFLQELSAAVAEHATGAMLIAEESTAWPGVTAAPPPGGGGSHLGFTYKWNMGWMNDTLRYLAQDPVYRVYHHDKVTFGLIYAFSEKFVLPLSHDEVVHGKCSLLEKIPGDDWQRFATLRAYLAFMWTHPGKKLLFMGGEFAQRREWNHDVSLDWHLLDAPMHRGVQRAVRDLNMLYRDQSALHSLDCDASGFHWVIFDDRAQSVFAFLRFGLGDAAPCLVVCNFTPVPRHDYRVGVPNTGQWVECFNSDSSIYGGSGLGNYGTVSAHAVPLHGLPASVALLLPPLCTVVFRLDQTG